MIIYVTLVFTMVAPSTNLTMRVGIGIKSNLFLRVHRIFHVSFYAPVIGCVVGDTIGL